MEPSVGDWTVAQLPDGQIRSKYQLPLSRDCSTAFLNLASALSARFNGECLTRVGGWGERGVFHITALPMSEIGTFLKHGEEVMSFDGVTLNGQWERYTSQLVTVRNTVLSTL